MSGSAFFHPAATLLVEESATVRPAGPSGNRRACFVDAKVEFTEAGKPVAWTLSVSARGRRRVIGPVLGAPLWNASSVPSEILRELDTSGPGGQLRRSAVDSYLDGRDEIFAAWCSQRFGFELVLPAIGAPLQ